MSKYYRRVWVKKLSLVKPNSSLSFSSSEPGLILYRNSQKVKIEIKISIHEESVVVMVYEGKDSKNR